MTKSQFEWDSGLDIYQRITSYNKKQYVITIQFLRHFALSKIDAIYIHVYVHCPYIHAVTMS